MTPRGGARPGSGRKPRPDPKAAPVFLGQLNPDARAAIVAQLIPQERGRILLAAAQNDILRLAAWRLGFTFTDAEGGDIGGLLEAVAAALRQDERGTVEKLAGIVSRPDQSE